MSKKKKCDKLILTEAEQMLVKLQKMSEDGKESYLEARSLLKWWLVHKSWTESQWKFVKFLTYAQDNGKEEKKLRKITKQKKYYLYAISDNTAIKIGYSCEVSKRLKALQTGHPTPLSLVWKHYVGKSEAFALKQEKKLHRYCKKYKVRGEWFKTEALELVKCWRVSEESKDLG